MKISYQWLQDFIDLKDQTPQDIARILTSRGLEVEAVTPLAKGFDLVVSAQILERKKHPEADRLSLCTVTLGKGDPLEIVCGAQNMKTGDKVALAQIGAELPNGVKIAKSKIRGVVSNGMLCSEAELKLAEEADGILILPSDTKLGEPLAKILGRDDVILELSLTPNRGDCLSHFGIARELAAALGRAIKETKFTKFDYKNSPLSTGCEAGRDGLQFFGAYLEGVKVGPSPAWVVKRLESVGARAINNVVDATNYVLFEYGQPQHAYDASKLEGKKLVIRKAKKAEKLPLLDATSVELQGTELVISDEKKAVALAGVMGGGNSEVQTGSTKLFLECAEFAPIEVRRSARFHQKLSESSHRFERGVDPRGLERALGRLATLITEWAGGKVVGSVKAQNELRAKPTDSVIVVPKDYFKEILGAEISEKEASNILIALGCKVEGHNGLRVTPPSFRLDLSIKEDLAEEVARSIGYDRIPSTIPALSSVPASQIPQDTPFEAIDRAKDILVRLGFREVLNYSFTSKNVLSFFGMDSSVAVLNPLSEETEVMVPSLIPGLVKTIEHNWNHHFGSEPLPLRLFELRPTFHKKAETEKPQFETRVKETWRLTFAMSGPRQEVGLTKDLRTVDFFDLKGAVEDLIEQMGAQGVRVKALSHSGQASVDSTEKLFHKGQCAEVLVGNQRAGLFGMVHPKFIQKLKIKDSVFLADLDWEMLLKASKNCFAPRVFTGWGEFPTMERDFALLVKEDVTSEQIVQLAAKEGRPLAKVVRVFDIYRGSQVPEGMTSIAVRVIFLEESRSLQEAEVEEVSKKILARWQKGLGAQLRS